MCFSHGAEIRVEQADKSSTKQKVEPAEGDEGRRVVEHASGRVLEETPLLEETVLHDVAKAMTLFQSSQEFCREAHTTPERWSPLP